ncbi:MAG: winged helix-turn-helix domain-containing protein [Pseudomonadales bacterium]|jgi:DNA-binding winged helix-turn-helix (wHTH) protein|nr:winged helix-turn-helix domain-containing protein [Pseudomonadales bacterium]
MPGDESDLLSESYAFGEFVLDAELCELRGPAGRVEVQRKVLRLLFFLARNANRVVGKEELLEAVWPGTVVSESVLSQAVRKARGALGDDGATQQLIRTVHGHGYCLEAEVRTLRPGAPTAAPTGSSAGERTALLTPAFDPGAQGETPEPAAAVPDFGPLPVSPPEPRRVPRWVWAVAGGALLAIAVVGMAMPA